MRKSIAVAVAALSVATTGVVLVDRPSTAAVGEATAGVGDVPADCSVSAVAYRAADAQRLNYGFSAGRPTSTESMFGDALWVPTAMTQMRDTSDETNIDTVEYAANARYDYLFPVVRHAEFHDGEWFFKTQSAGGYVGPSYAGTRVLAASAPYVYSLSGSVLYRSKEVLYDDGEYGLTDPVKVATNWGSVNTLIFERRAGTGTSTVDVLIGTKSNGELKEWRINRATPIKITSTVLRGSGWESFTTLANGRCTEHPNGRVLLGITAAGSATVRFDPNRTDGVGSDFVGGSLGSLGWTEKAFGL
jgi:hypothetical protein